MRSLQSMLSKYAVGSLKLFCNFSQLRAFKRMKGQEKQMERSDHQIMTDFSNGDSDAINEIFLRYKGRILNFCLRILGNRADAEDATADTFVNLLADRYRYNPDAKFSTWLFTVARNTCISRIRKRKRSVSMWFQTKDSSQGFEPWDPVDTQDISNEQLHKKEAALKVKTAINSLPIEQKEALILREYEKLKYDEIANILNCSLSNVKILIFRAREHIKKDLQSFMKETS